MSYEIYALVTYLGKWYLLFCACLGAAWLWERAEERRSR